MRLQPCLALFPCVTISVTSSYLNFLQNSFLFVLSISSTFFLTGPFLSHFVPQNFHICGIECFLSTNKTPAYTCPFFCQIPYPSCNMCCRLGAFGFSFPPRTVFMFVFLALQPIVVAFSQPSSGL